MSSPAKPCLSRYWLRVIVAWAVVILSGSTKAAEAEPLEFVRDVRPLLKRRCVSCHGPVEQEAHLRLDAGQLLLKGGDSGPAIVAHQSSQSLLIERVSAKDPAQRMPPTGPELSADEIELLARWIDQGAKIGPDDVAPASVQEHWSFQPLVAVPLPAVEQKDWPRNAIDYFVLAKLEQRGWSPNPPATSAALLRRAYLDLLGLPPTLAEQEAYLQRADEESYARLVADLLARPAYGERYARHWLDVVRYADSNGYERDAAKPEVWRYRDYVIAALNADKPFDEFVVEQLAGDEMPGATTNSVLATGYNRLGPWDDEPADPAMDHFDQLDDLVSTTSQAFLGLTLGCARCHNHKFEPLSQRDYYSLVAVFHGLERPRNGREELTRPALPASVIHGNAAGGKAARAEPSAATQASASPTSAQEALAVPAGYFLFEPSAAPPKTHILLRGSPRQLGEEVGPAPPAILQAAAGTIGTVEAPGATSGRRLALAQWLTRRDNPLTARVIVNRVWQWHFGQGLVRSANDLGLMGDRPQHAELLNYLAHWFVHDADWSLKKLHYLVMTSRTYQMSRASRALYLAEDPENRWLWRQSYQRLEVEVIRDAVLAVSGQLDSQMYGPPIFPEVPADALRSHTDRETIWPAFDERAAARRTVYAFVKRSLVIPMLEVLDFCDTTRSAPQRNVTTVPTQALTLLNGDFINRQAQYLAQRIQQHHPVDRSAQIDTLWRLTLCRAPTNEERSSVLEFLAAQSAPRSEPSATSEPSVTSAPSVTSTGDATVDSALIHLCRVVLNLNEFVYPE